MGSGMSGVAFQAKRARDSQYETLEELKKAQLVPEGWEYLPGNYTPPEKIGQNISRDDLNGSKVIDVEFASEIDPAAQPLYDVTWKLLDRLMGKGSPKEPPKLKYESEEFSKDTFKFADGTVAAGGNSTKGTAGHDDPKQRGMVPTEVRAPGGWGRGGQGVLPRKAAGAGLRGPAPPAGCPTPKLPQTQPLSWQPPTPIQAAPQIQAPPA